MRLLLITVGAFAAMVCTEKLAKAQNYPWCAYYNFQHGGATNCGWATFEQCLATVRGIGGSCGPYTRRLGTRGVILIEGL